MAQCEAISNPKSDWAHFCPNIGAAYLYAVLFGLTTIVHIAQMIIHRKTYSLVIVISAGMQTATYILRVLSIQNVTNSNFYSDWFILIMVAPVWTNAYVYMVMGRMVYNFTPSASVFKVKAWRFGLIFVLLDVTAFVVQFGGAAVASVGGSVNPMIGIHIYMGGIGLQQLVIFFFLALAVRLHKKLLLQSPSADRSRGLILLYVQYAVVGLITVRIIYRLIEYSSGVKSTIPRHEAYQYVFDSTLMLIAIALFNIFHPGRLMPGQESNLPSRKVRKNMKKQGEKPRGRVGGDYLLPKYEEAADEPMTENPTSRGGYARLTTPSPVRGMSYEDRPDHLMVEAPSPPQRYSSEGYSYTVQDQGLGA